MPRAKAYRVANIYGNKLGSARFFLQNFCGQTQGYAADSGENPCGARSRDALEVISLSGSSGGIR